MKKVFQILGKKWYLVIIVYIAIIGQCYLQLQLPDRMNAIQNLITDINSTTNKILIEGGWMILISVGVFILATFQNYFCTYLAAFVSKELRREMFKKVNTLSLGDYNKFGTATLITRTTNDVEQIKNFLIMGIRTAVMSPTYMIIALVLIFTNNYTDPKLAIVLAIVLPLILVGMGILLAVTSPLFKKLQINIDNITVCLRENLTGIRVVRAYNQQETEDKKFDDANLEATKTIAKASKIMSLADPLVSVFFNISYVAIFALGYYLMDGVSLSNSALLSNQVSGIVVVSQYSTQIMQSFIMLAMLLIMIPQAFASIKRINEVINCQDSIKDYTFTKDEEEKFLNREKGVIEFKNVTFAYPDSNIPCIKNISFKTKTGKTTAIIGSTGSGKSTIINLIPRFYDPSEGEILLDGFNIKNIPLKSLKDNIGFVPQQALLFSGTIEENIKFGNKEATTEDINNVLAIAQAKHFVDKLPEGINSQVSQSGKNFSGGQKQRLCIARALVRKPEIYVFDDSFSALDFKTDAKLRLALKEYTTNSSIIIVAQRVSSILDADNILVINDGECVGQGNHQELLKNCKVYQDIVKSQLDEEEVKKTIEMLNKIKNGGNL